MTIRIWPIRCGRRESCAARSPRSGRRPPTRRPSSSSRARVFRSTISSGSAEWGSARAASSCSIRAVCVICAVAPNTLRANVFRRASVSPPTIAHSRYDRKRTSDPASSRVFVSTNRQAHLRMLALRPSPGRSRSTTQSDPPGRSTRSTPIRIFAPLVFATASFDFLCCAPRSAAEWICRWVPMRVRKESSHGSFGGRSVGQRR